MKFLLSFGYYCDELKKKKSSVVSCYFSVLHKSYSSHTERGSLLSINHILFQFETWSHMVSPQNGLELCVIEHDFELLVFCLYLHSIGIFST